MTSAGRLLTLAFREKHERERLAAARTNNESNRLLQLPDELLLQVLSHVVEPGTSTHNHLPDIVAPDALTVLDGRINQARQYFRHLDHLTVCKRLYNLAHDAYFDRTFHVTMRAVSVGWSEPIARPPWSTNIRSSNLISMGNLANHDAVYAGIKRLSLTLNPGRFPSGVSMLKKELWRIIIACTKLQSLNLHIVSKDPEIREDLEWCLDDIRDHHLVNLGVWKGFGCLDESTREMKMKIDFEPEKVGA